MWHRVCVADDEYERFVDGLSPQLRKELEEQVKLFDLFFGQRPTGRLDCEGHDHDEDIKRPHAE